MTPGPHVLVVDADATTLERSSVLLTNRGFTVTAISSDDIAFGSACDTVPAAVVTSLNHRDGLVLELLRIIRQSSQIWTSADFPVLCPKCGSHAGLPRVVATVPSGGVEITAACSACSYEWDMHRESDRLPNGES